MTGNEHHGVLLIGHGTRDQGGIAQFHDLCGCVARRLDPVPVEQAFLELQQPDIGQAITRLIERGVRRLTVMPLLLFAAGHAKRDIPAAIQAAIERSGVREMEVLQAAHFGLHPALVELSRLRGEQALRDKLPLPPEECCLLIVGRGSGEESAIAEMYEFARLRQMAGGGIDTEVAFVAMAHPLLRETLRRLAASEFRWVLVQPHLLFQGEIADSIREQVAKLAAEHSKLEWIVTSLLADPPGQNGRGSEILANVILDRLNEAGIRVVAFRDDD
jgi:sirohydrochlorin cobaltochelatase